MKRFFLSSSIAAVVGLTLAGCISSQPEPQKRDYTKGGKSVMSKDIYSITPTTNKNLGAAVFTNLFSAANKDITGNYSLTLVTIPAGQGVALHTLTSSETIYVISGGGMLKVNGEAIPLREGISVYIPPNAKQSTFNNSQEVLKFVTIVSPAFTPESEKILGQPPVPINVKPKEPAESQGAVANEPTPKKMDFTTGDLPNMNTGPAVQSKGDMKIGVPEAEIKKLEKSMDADISADKLLKKADEATQAAQKIIKERKQAEKQQQQQQQQAVQKVITQETDKLLPRQPQTVKKVNLKNVQELTPQEQRVPNTPNN
jgi:mannose-6-phosphate isomerase-like protein (cupin superfamily)